MRNVFEAQVLKTDECGASIDTSDKRVVLQALEEWNSTQQMSWSSLNMDAANCDQICLSICRHNIIHIYIYVTIYIYM